MVARKSEHPTHTEWFLTGVPSARADPDPPDAVFRRLAERLAAERITVLHERIYGRRAAHPHLLTARAAALAAAGVTADWPVTVLDGAPASGADFGGVQLWGVSLPPGSNQHVQTVTSSDAAARIVGRVWSGPDFRLLLLAGVDGLPPAGAGDGAPQQADRMFQRATAALGAHGSSFRQVVRTWIYLPRILDWYGDFNRVRSAHYGPAGLSATGPAPFPASTGIQARRDLEECSMDLLAVDTTATSSPGALTVRPILRSARQGQAAAYGSAFARAMVLDRGGRKIIHVSGTASIDAGGHSTYPGDVAAQYVGTLLSIAALLEEEGATLADIVQGTRFVKQAAFAADAAQVTRRLGLPTLPLLDVVADVCRPELLLEIEAVAVVSRP